MSYSDAAEGPPEGGGARDLMYLLERLESILTTAWHFPMSSRVMVDEQECLDVVDQIKLALPNEVKLARRVVAERDKILEETRAEAEQVIARAEQHVATRIEDHSVVQAAQARAHALLDRAEREVNEARRQSDEYAYGVFSSLHRRLEQIDGIVREGLEELRPHEPTENAHASMRDDEQ